MRTILKKHPLITGMLSYTTVWTASSITQQKYISKHKVDYSAVVRNVTVATFMMAPLLHGWYRVMGLWSKGAMTWRWSAKITLAEQTIFAPCILTTFFVGSGVVAGSSPMAIQDELRCKLPQVYLTSCCFFPFITFFNHLYVPFHLKTVYQASAAFVWSNFLCYMKEKNISTVIYNPSA